MRVLPVYLLVSRYDARMGDEYGLGRVYSRRPDLRAPEPPQRITQPRAQVIPLLIAGSQKRIATALRWRQSFPHPRNRGRCFTATPFLCANSAGGGCQA